MIRACFRDLWIKNHRENFAPFSLKQHGTYASLFKHYVYQREQLEDQTVLLRCNKEHFGRSRKILVRKLKGPCFGVCRALLHYHLQDPKFAIEQFQSDQTFIHTALFYSLLDLTRAKVDQIRFFQKEGWKPVLDLMQRESLPEQKTFYFEKGGDPLNFLDGVMHYLEEKPDSLMLLRVWSEFSNGKNPLIKMAKWQPSHVLFLCMNAHKGKFYFYDTKIKGFVSSKTFEEFLVSFRSFLQVAYSKYLSPHIYWRFTSVAQSVP